ncbi:MAG: hypothetical protein ACOC4K_01500 [Verrucomicrobiota bacterium]
MGSLGALLVLRRRRAAQA